NIVYKGRSQYPGLDQLNVVVPPGVSGCYVSVVVRSGNLVSNFSSIPVTASGRTCSDQTTGVFGFSPGQLQSIAGKSSIASAVVGLNKTTTNIPALVVNGITITPANTYATDFGSAAFSRITLPQQFDPYVYQASPNGIASIGSCSVYTFVLNSQTPPPVA